MLDLLVGLSLLATVALWCYGVGFVYLWAIPWYNPWEHHSAAWFVAGFIITAILVMAYTFGDTVLS
jgi:hypothetical protein